MTETPPLYARVMGKSWTQVAEPIRCLHRTGPIVRARGPLRVEHGRLLLARFVAWVLRLPRPGAAAETSLVVTARADGERWERTFDGRRFETRQYESNRSALAERYGVLEFLFRLDATAGSLVYVLRQAAFLFWWLRLPMPARWAPRVEAREDPAGPKRVKIGVRVVLPVVGLLIAYDGLIDVEDTNL